MFGIGMPELIVIFIVALLVIGPKKLPDFARSLGKGLQEFRRTADGLRESLSQDLGLDEVRQAAYSAFKGDDQERPKAGAAEDIGGGAAEAEGSDAPGESPEARSQEPSAPEEFEEKRDGEQKREDPADPAAESGKA